MTYPFEGEDEERRALRWMKARLKEVGDARKDGQKAMIEDLDGELADRLVVLQDGGPRHDDDWYAELWDRFTFAVSGVYPDDADEKWEAPFVQGEWDWEDAQTLPLGYSKQLIQTTIPRGGGSAIHSYTKPPKRVSWKMVPITQKGVTFFVGKARVAEIDAVCSVPQLPGEMDSEEAGLRVLDPKRGDQEWQRRVEARRVLSIKNFIDASNNIIANAAILYVPRHRAVTANDNGQVTVDFSKFLHQAHGRWQDHEEKRDLRPIWLIDGQHRTRGLAQSKEGIELEIPIILFPPGFNLSNSAKIFAEINTLQKKLTPLHTLFMQHRFHIPSPIAKRDFRKPWKDEKPETWDSRANHLSYECAAYLTSSEDGPLRGRIRMLDQNPPRIPIIQASQWVDFSRSWYLQGGIYGPDSPETQEEMNQEVENYFRAFVSTCNHGDWPDGRPRWTPGGHNKGLCQRQGPSQSLLRLYPSVWTKAKQGRSGVVAEEAFKEVLKPLRWVDWLDNRLLPVFGGSGERPRTALRIWMENAIAHGKCFPLEEVMAGNLHSLPGRGMLASPGNGTLKTQGQHKWPAPGRPVTLIADQPANTLSGSRWSIFDSNGVNRSPVNSTVFARNGAAELPLHYQDWMKAVTHVDVRVDWYNTVLPPGRATIMLTRPS